jgi:uncharacterized membrane protein
MQNIFLRLLSGLVVLFLGLAASHAQGSKLPPLLPNLFTVTGVESDDVLNVRNAPDLNSAKVGSLDPDARLEVTALSDDRKWARIIFQERDGWVSTRYLALDGDTASAGIPPVLICIGTEPFWSLGFTAFEEEAKLEFNDIEHDWKVWPAAKISTPANRGFRSFSAVDSGVAAVFGRHECSDDMSDRTYGWVVDLLFLGEQPNYLQGCCMMVLD